MYLSFTHSAKCFLQERDLDARIRGEKRTAPSSLADSDRGIDTVDAPR